MPERRTGWRVFWGDRWKWRTHVLAFVCFGLILLYVKAAWFDGVWYLRLMLIWSAVLVGHYMALKLATATDGWADARASDIRRASPDIKHISQIVDSAVDGDPATDPAALKPVSLGRRKV